MRKSLPLIAVCVVTSSALLSGLSSEVLANAKSENQSSQLQLSQYPHPTPNALTLAATNAIEAKDYRMAIQLSNAALKLAPRYAAAYAMRGVALSEMGQKEEAKLDLAKARQLLLVDLLKAQSKEDTRLARAGLQLVQIYLQ